MKHPSLSRRGFLKTSTALAGLSLAGPALPAAEPARAAPGASTGDLARTPPRPAGQKPVHQLTTPPLERVRIGVIGLHRGMAHIRDALGVEFAQIVAVCDIREDRALAAAERCVKAGRPRPEVYMGTDSIWEKLVDRGDLDVVYVATPWDWHVPMCLRAMQRGKHAFVEVAAAITVNDCWQLVDASERTQRHCVMLENCCYGENELFVLNLVRQGVFGTLKHAECAYIHDLREVLYQLGSEGDWRRDYHERLNGNLYPTHGLGPVAQYLGVGRGDRFQFLVSTSSLEASLTARRNEVQPNGGRHAAETYVCGDMNTSILKTERGRTIMLQHDVVSPRPYSRINALSGTGATFFDYPARLAIDQPARYGLESKGSHDWLNEKDLAKMREQFTHPLWRQLVTRAAGSGHGGMDFVMNYRHLDCIRRGVTPDSDVYDAAAWSCIVELSTRSVASGSMPVTFPDFTRGLWQTMTPVGIAEATAARA
ncbi:MAG TPA: Gfo/Idh/MocA family oxidoreductase [Lacunisphaera sp.]|nr:Gfo/Idh/MocA family oxidoreductase [Lacunisphaera sp.]